MTGITTTNNEPWLGEPAPWHHEMMAMLRGPMGAWCGYVAVGPRHPLHGKSYQSIVKPPRHILNREVDMVKISVIDLLCGVDDLGEGVSVSLCFDVHGGLTYSDDHCPGAEPDGNWWFGFDCSHAGDIVPRLVEEMPDYPPAPGDVYRTFDYAKAEVLSLAKQMVAWRGDEDDR